MNASELKQNFTNQLQEIDEKINQINAELKKAQEYKVKLQGGLETLELLENSQSLDSGELPDVEPPLPKSYKPPVEVNTSQKVTKQVDKDGNVEHIIIEEH